MLRDLKSTLEADLSMLLRAKTVRKSGLEDTLQAPLSMKYLFVMIWTSKSQKFSAVLY